MNRYHLKYTLLYPPLDLEEHFLDRDNSLSVNYKIHTLAACSQSCSWPFSEMGHDIDMTWSFDGLLYYYSISQTLHGSYRFWCWTWRWYLHLYTSHSWWSNIIIIITSSQIFIYSISNSSTQHFFIEVESTFLW